METLNFELKAEGVTDAGEFQGYASTYGNIDKQRDRIEVGAFAADHGKEVPILWSHRADEPVGLGKLEDTPQGVTLKGKLNLETTAGREAYSNLKRGIVKALSIGFEMVRHEFQGAIRIIKQGAIKEVSLVLFPANPAALVTDVKGADCPARELLRYCG